METRLENMFIHLMQYKFTPKLHICHKLKTLEHNKKNQACVG